MMTQAMARPWRLKLLIPIAIFLGFGLGATPDARVALAQKAATATGDSSAPGPASLVIAPTESSPDAEAIRDLIAKTNYDQIYSIASGDPAFNSSVGTDRYHGASLRVNQELLASGATSLDLVELEWGTIVITGNTAVATTHETWAMTTGAGVGVQAAELNLYELVYVNGAWKIDANVHPNPVPAATPAPRR